MIRDSASNTRRAAPLSDRWVEASRNLLQTESPDGILSLAQTLLASKWHTKIVSLSAEGPPAQELAGQGHCGYPELGAVEHTTKLVEIDQGIVEDAVPFGVEAGSVIRDVVETEPWLCLTGEAGRTWRKVRGFRVGIPDVLSIYGVGEGVPSHKPVLIAPPPQCTLKECSFS